MSENLLQQNSNGEELTHTDKMIGVFSEPASMFGKIVRFPIKNIDWVIPAIIYALIAIAVNALIMTNAEIKQQLIDKQLEELSKTFDEQVEKGYLTREQADEQYEKAEELITGGGFGAIGTVIQAVSTFIFIFLLLFIISGIHFMICKFILKGDGSFNSVLVVNGLAYYIGALQALAMLIIALATSKFMSGVSIGALMGLEKSTIDGKILNMLDPFTIWSLYVIGIGLSKVFKASSAKNYLIAIYALWFFWGMATFGIAKAVPFLKFLNM